MSNDSINEKTKRKKGVIVFDLADVLVIIISDIYKAGTNNFLSFTGIHNRRLRKP